MSGSQLITWPMPPMSCEISTFVTPLPVRVQPCVLDSMLFRCISEALPCTLMHCIPDSTCYAAPHHPLHLHLCMCCLCLFVCLFVSPSRLFPLIDGQLTSTKSNCTCSIRRGLVL